MSDHQHKWVEHSTPLWTTDDSATLAQTLLYCSECAELNLETIENKDWRQKYACPKCNGLIPSKDNVGAYPGALSRADNLTEICSDCGVAEAIADFKNFVNQKRDAE